MKKNILFVLVLLFSLCLYGQDYPTKTINGVRYYVYNVAKSEGIYRISKRFNVSQEAIIQVNPTLTEGLKEGQIIYIPVEGSRVEQSSQASPKQVIYEVKRRETLYSISKKFGISINQIISDNPFAQDGVRKGDILQIFIPNIKRKKNETTDKSQKKVEAIVPKSTSKHSVRHIVKPKETIYGISRYYNLETERLMAVNPKLSKGLKIGDTITIPPSVATPYIKEANNINAVPNSIADTLRRYKVVYLLPLSADKNIKNINTERFVEFYRGSLIAMEHLKKQGVSLDVYVFDNQLNAEETRSLLKNKMPKDVDMIIGPAYPEQVSIVAKYTKEESIHHIVPFTSKIKEKDKHSLLYQFNPSGADISKKVTEYVLQKNGKSNFYFIDFDDDKIHSSPLVYEMRKALKNRSIRYVNIDAKRITEAQLSTLANGKNNFVVLSKCSKNDYREFASKLESYNLKNTVLMADEHIFALAMDNRNLTPKDFIAYSLFCPNPDKLYVDTYTKYFGKREVNTTPNYDLLGYDLTLYFCSTQKMDKSLVFQSYVDLQQSNLDFGKKALGFLNTGCYMYHFQNGVLTIERI